MATPQGGADTACDCVLPRPRPHRFTAWRWDFGDGLTSTLQNPTHQYTALGVYTVGLTITSGLQADRLVRPAYITVTNPVNAQFTASPLSGYGPLTVTFTDQSVTILRQAQSLP